MCGIIGYVGDKQAYPILLNGLKQLEYRGYDSAGICTINEKKMKITKEKGRVNQLESAQLPGNIGIGHTRWATHGIPSNNNSHPFTDNTNSFAIVHNGIIENYLELKEGLIAAGVNFSSDTDSEVIVHLIKQAFQGDLMQAVLKVIPKLIGAFALCVINKGEETILAARNGSPLVVGVGTQENFIASDQGAFIEYTKNVIYINDYEIVELNHDSIKIFDFSGEPINYKIKQIDWNLESAQKSGFKHFMLKEIYEQPQVISNSVISKTTLHARRIIIVACGTANYAGLIGKYLIEKNLNIPVVHEIASEFRYKKPMFQEGDLVMAISQSGETADTLAAINLAKSNGVKTLGIINVRESSIARVCDQVIYTNAGREIGVASTKAFFAQVLTFIMLCNNKINKPELIKKVEETLQLNDQIKEIAKKYYLNTNFMYLGRNINFPLALEGALKLKEISYIHAQGYPAGELKHGPIALISEDMPTFVICPQDHVYSKTLSNIEEIKARSGKVIALTTQGETKLKQICDDVIYVPTIESDLLPILLTIPLQLFAYHMADLKECDIDKPRNLAKSVTVE